jgi:hypothetical protein
MSEDSYSRAVIKTVEDMTTALYQVRADVSRSITTIYQRIVEIERRMREDSQAREARQQVIDRSLARLERRAVIRLWLEVAIGLGMLIVIGLLLVR